MFATPVPGYLHPMGWSRPAGNIEFVVTRGCKEHLATGVGCALDIGNARQGAPVFAMAAGKVTSRYIQNTPGQVGHGALIMRVTHADGWSSGYAHLQSFSVAKDAIVGKGQQIGVLGATGYGITGPHLHTDVKLNGVARDLWPLLDQNIAEDDVDPSFQPIVNRTIIVKPSSNHRDAPNLTGSVVYTGPASPAEQPLGYPVAGTVTGTIVLGSPKWYAYWHPTPKRWQYLHDSRVIREEAVEATADCGEAVAAATAPLEKQVTTLAAMVKAQEQKITDAKVALG